VFTTSGTYPMTTAYQQHFEH